MVRLNLLGSLYCAHAALPHLLRAAETGPREVADLVNISSLSGRTVRVGSAVYNATKHAMNAYSESLRQEVAGRPRGSEPAPGGARLPATARRGCGRRHRLRRHPPKSRRGERTADPAHLSGTLNAADVFGLLERSTPTPSSRPSNGHPTRTSPTGAPRPSRQRGSPTWNRPPWHSCTSS
jgi:NAD(P)-dependent dehydrogenase (short-subunit alcohol dehydrogenase family)